MTDRHTNAAGDRTALPDRIGLTTDEVTGQGAQRCADALAAAGVAVTRHTFLPLWPGERTTGILLLTTPGPPPPLVGLIAPAAAPPDVLGALVDALEGEGQDAPAILQLKAADIFVSIQARDRADLLRVLDGLGAEIARLDVQPGERRLIYSAGRWSIDP